jgi:lipoate-protein ligase A
VRVEDLYDYDELRARDVATVYLARADLPTLVLGGHQSPEIVNSIKVSHTPVRRRRGGGGLVLLRPDDLWIDWWIPHDDARWSHDVRVSSLLVGSWWASALRVRTRQDVSVHEGPLEGSEAHRVVCFAGRGPGEVFVAGHKAVGLTQWRVREGVFLSTVLHVGATTDVLDYLNEVPSGLAAALDHHTLSSLRIGDREELIEELVAMSSPWDVHQHHLV